MVKCVLLLSGGLDSTLAGGMMRELGVEVKALSFSSPFCTCTPKGQGCSAARKSAEQLGIPLRSLACGPDYLEIMKHPCHGRGKGANACIDCRIHLFRRAGEYMREIGADFVVTGEVLGERPMSQRRDAMMLIERESGLRGLVVRPLSARLLPPSKAEQDGLIDRDKMLAIQGRRRLPQMELADKLGIKDYLCPGGGCMLTQKEFAAKFLDLVEHDPEFDLDDTLLLRQGRHFRLPGGCKAIVGRNEEENNRLERARHAHKNVLVPVRVPGPTVLYLGNAEDADLKQAARLLAYHVKPEHQPVGVNLLVQDSEPCQMGDFLAPDQELVEAWRVTPENRPASRSAKTHNNLLL